MGKGYSPGNPTRPFEEEPYRALFKNRVMAGQRQAWGGSRAGAVGVEPDIRTHALTVKTTATTSKYAQTRLLIKDNMLVRSGPAQM